ncbi:hypothetical protein O9993_16705 [Vibrio lentus]|nr:hypothetical protein [Vibrio lentus]
MGETVVDGGCVFLIGVLVSLIKISLSSDVSMAPFGHLLSTPC